MANKSMRVMAKLLRIKGTFQIKDGQFGIARQEGLTIHVKVGLKRQETQPEHHGSAESYGIQNTIEELLIPVGEIKEKDDGFGDGSKDGAEGRGEKRKDQAE
eukprot:CAMPEP_0170549876 /NCGR_PEP_ID=MMETSP0211-20121228/7992_1 /TAXON_ID=311385 /ORGANISM="Pseudokeronopsis sp., Strain OXSARD2" /LENGTH=101 /DNA_ID=CAMNT_0010856127 /DNA_START=239 /DNA_END=545 /DNA_ORIENTATION=+